jgi:UDPglucose 6-dehydrogenase
VKISVVGLGYVGLVTMAVLSDNGYNLVGIDTDREKIQRLQEGEVPIYEPGLSVLIEKNRKMIEFSNSYDSIKGSEYTIICVPTPTVNDRIDVHYVIESGKKANEIDPNSMIVIKSTVTPGTAKMLSEIINKDILSNPEFLREGNAVKDTINPDRIVIGGRAGVENFSRIWSFTNSKIIMTTNENAELIKYASNAFLATKISFINQMADLCEKIPGADIKVVADGMGMDKRIGRAFLNAGPGYGGSCFPKDTRAIVSFAEDVGVELSIIKCTVNYNEDRIRSLVNRIEKIITDKSSRIIVLGLSFKENTGDLRESKSVELIMELKRRGYDSIKAFDPVTSQFNGIDLFTEVETALEWSEFVIVATEWPSFSDFLKRVKDKHIIDLRRIIDDKTVKLDYGVGLNATN